MGSNKSGYLDSLQAQYIYLSAGHFSFTMVAKAEKIGELAW